jgi:hypothetical protein
LLFGYKLLSLMLFYYVLLHLMLLCLMLLCLMLLCHILRCHLLPLAYCRSSSSCSENDPAINFLEVLLKKKFQQLHGSGFTKMGRPIAAHEQHERAACK